MTTQTIKYYVFDSIVCVDGEYRGYRNGQYVEVLPLESTDTESELIETGWAKCDAEGTETFIVEETAWESIA
jgi:hypothetical protein